MRETPSSPGNRVSIERVFRFTSKAVSVKLGSRSRLLDAANLEERKELIHAFVSGVTVHPEEARLDVMVAQMPIPASNSSVGVVAAARYEPGQMDLRPLDRFMAGLLRVA